MKKIFAILLLLTTFAVQGWSSDICSVGLSKNFTSTDTSYTDSASSTQNGQKYYFTFSEPGSVNISVTTSNNHLLTYSKTTCPTNSGGSSSLDFDVDATDLDFNLMVYRGTNGNASYTLNIEFVPNSILTGIGLTGEYFNRTSSNDSYNMLPVAGTPNLSRIDSTVNFNWASLSPQATTINNDYFQAKWSGYIYIPSDGDWRFYTQSDDGVQLTFNNQIIISAWTNHSSREDSSTVLSLTKGYYPVKMEYYERTGQAVAALKWSGPSRPITKVIPQAYLFPVFTPKADYHFDECSWNGTTNEVADSSGNNFNATSTNSLNTVSGGPLCRATTFNGSTQYISASNIATYLQKTASLSFWIKTTQTGNDTMWLAPGVSGVEESGGGNDIFWGWLDASGHIGILKGNTAGAKSTNPINDGTWKHIVLTRDSSTGSVQVYVNGALNQTATSETGDVTTAFSSIGRIEDTDGTPAYFRGSLDEVKVFDKVLSSYDVDSIYNHESGNKNYDGTTRSCTVCAPPPLVEYRFDECSWSGTSNDIIDSANAYNASAINNANTTASDKVLCNAADLSIANKYIELPSTHYIPLSTPWSLTTWVKFPLNPASHQNISGINYFIIGSTQGTGDLAYFGRNISSGAMVWGVYSNPGGSSEVAISTPSNGWHFVTFINDGTSTKFYLDSQYISSINKSTSGNVRFIGTSYDGPTSQNMGTLLDEYKIFSLALTDEQRNFIYHNEASGYSFDGFIRTCPICTVTPDPTYSFDAWDSFRSISDRNISTKIVNKSFDLNISSLDSTNNVLQDFNGTVCTKIVDSAGNAITGWNKSLFNTAQSATTTFTINRAIGGSDSAGVKLYWKKNVDSTCPIIGEDNTTMASDRFSVRPASFTVTAPNAIAGVDFNITFTAPNFSGTTSADYNESSGSSFEVNVAEHNPLCAMGTFNPIPNSFSFLNGTKIFTTRYSEVGVLDINITDLTKACGAKYANIDCDDADVAGYYSAASDLPIGLTQAQITIKPHHFDVTGTLSNFSGGTFTYLSDDLNMSAQLDLNITAKNGEGTTTANYSLACYAKNTDLTLVHSSIPDPLTKILYTETLSALNTNVLKADPWVLSLNSTLFSNGSVAPNIDLNFDRSPTKPLNPFDFNITSATATDADAVTGTGAPLGDATFVYGRVHAYDITSNSSPVNTPIEFEVYSTVSNGFVSGMPQNVLKWYRNLDHDIATDGNVISGGFNAGTTDGDIDTSDTPTDGLQIVEITSINDQTIHLDISPWLWYSPKYSYDYNGDCTRHPCFNYDYTDASVGIQGVNSGTFQGSDFQMTPAKNITNKGVKLFR